MEHYSTKLIDFKVYVVIVSKLYTTLLTVNIPNFYYVNSCYTYIEDKKDYSVKKFYFLYIDFLTQE